MQIAIDYFIENMKFSLAIDYSKYSFEEKNIGEKRRTGKTLNKMGQAEGLH